MRITPLADLNEPFPQRLSDMPDSWPEFMLNDRTGNLYYGLAQKLFPEYVFVCEDLAERGRLAAKAFAVPFHSGDELPDDGWDGVIRQAVLTRLTGAVADRVSAIEISIRPDLQGKGLSGPILAAMRAQMTRLGFAELLAPVRPNGKRDPREPMREYAFRTRPDGLPVDPWLRVHVRAGGEIVQVAPRSMVIDASVEQWRSWTGLPFDRTGTVVVPGALAPVLCDIEHGHAVYIEPNVWVRHRLKRTA